MYLSRSLSGDDSHSAQEFKNTLEIYNLFPFMGNLIAP